MSYGIKYIKTFQKMNQLLSAIGVITTIMKTLLMKEMITH